MGALLLQYLAPNLRSRLSSLRTWDKVEEIRLRVNQPLAVKEQRVEYGINHQGVCQLAEGYRVTVEDLTRTVVIMTENSWYALEVEIRAGYLTLTGGHGRYLRQSRP